ncbi:MAG: hypothetical protein AABW79_00800 [Nanoarchaeota archaeon]
MPPSELSDVFLRNLFNSRRGERINSDFHESEFTARDLIGKTIISERIIQTNQENPEIIRAIYFQDGSALISGSYGNGECGHLHFFLVDRDGMDKYASSKLFDAL